MLHWRDHTFFPVIADTLLHTLHFNRCFGFALFSPLSCTDRQHYMHTSVCLHVNACCTSIIYVRMFHVCCSPCMWQTSLLINNLIISCIMHVSIESFSASISTYAGGYVTMHVTPDRCTRMCMCTHMETNVCIYSVHTCTQ